MKRATVFISCFSIFVKRFLSLWFVGEFNEAIVSSVTDIAKNACFLNHTKLSSSFSAHTDAPMPRRASEFSHTAVRTSSLRAHHVKKDRSRCFGEWLPGHGPGAGLVPGDDLDLVTVQHALGERARRGPALVLADLGLAEVECSLVALEHRTRHEHDLAPHDLERLLRAAQKRVHIREGRRGRGDLLRRDKRGLVALQPDHLARHFVRLHGPLVLLRRTRPRVHQRRRLTRHALVERRRDDAVALVEGLHALLEAPDKGHQVLLGLEQAHEVHDQGVGPPVREHGHEAVARERELVERAGVVGLDALRAVDHARVAQNIEGLLRERGAELAHVQAARAEEHEIRDLHRLPRLRGRGRVGAHEDVLLEAPGHVALLAVRDHREQAEHTRLPGLDARVLHTHAHVLVVRGVHVEHIRAVRAHERLEHGSDAVVLARVELKPLPRERMPEHPIHELLHGAETRTHVLFVVDQGTPPDRFVTKNRPFCQWTISSLESPPRILFDDGRAFRILRIVFYGDRFPRLHLQRVIAQDICHDLGLHGRKVWAWKLHLQSHTRLRTTPADFDRHTRELHA